MQYGLYSGDDLLLIVFGPKDIGEIFSTPLIPVYKYTKA